MHNKPIRNPAVCGGSIKIAQATSTPLNVMEEFSGGFLSGQTRKGLRRQRGSLHCASRRPLVSPYQRWQGE